MTGDAHPLLRGFRPHAALALLVVAIYAQTASFGLTLLDDNVFFEKQLPFLSRWSNLPSLFARSSMLGGVGPDDYYRPVLALSIMLDVLLGGGSLIVAHLSNVLYHAIATVLVFSMFRKLGYGDCSIVLASIFAAHPLLAQAVAWIPGRTDSLLAVFLLASFNAWLDHLRDPRWSSLARHLGFFALALLVKELAIVLPAICLLHSWKLQDRRRTAILCSGWAILLVLWFVVRRAILNPSAGFSGTEAATSLFGNLPAAALYASQCWLPVRLSPYPILQDVSWAWVSAGLVLAAAVLVFRRPEQPRRALWGAAWFLIFLLPSFLYPARSITPVFFEYRAYLPLIGMLVLLAESGLLRTFSLSGRAMVPWAVLVVLFAAGAVANSRFYRDASSCWERATQASPHSAFAHKQLGAAYLRIPDLPRAEAALRTALSLNPREPNAHNNLGTILLKTGRRGEAAEEYKTELEGNPGSADAFYNLGLIRLDQGRREEAADFWRRALAADPDFIDAYVNLSAYYLLRGDRPRAESYAREALRRGGTLPPALAEKLPGLPYK